MKEAAYKGMERPVLKYGSSVWDPNYDGLKDELKKVQKLLQLGLYLGVIPLEKVA